MMTDDAEQIERDRRQAGSGDGADADRADALFRSAFTMLARLMRRLNVELAFLQRLKPTFAGQMRIPLADEIQRTRQQDRGEAAEHHRRQNLRKDLALRHAGQGRIADRQRNGALADAAGHDRHDDIEEGVIAAETQCGADQGSDDGCRDRSDGQRNEDLQEATDQHVAVHAENTADDDGGDKDVEEVGRLGEFDDRAFDLRRYQVVVNQSRRNEGRKNRSGTDIAQDRNPFPYFGAGEAAHHEDSDHGRSVRLDLAGHDQRRDQNEQDEVDRKRDNADAKIDQLPPSLRPVSLAGGRGINSLML